MKSIIVATDFSKSGDNAVRYAVNAAYRAGCRLVLLTLYNPPQLALNARISSESEDALMAIQVQKLSMIKDIIKSTYALAVEFHIVYGNFLEDLRRCINQYNANVLIVGLENESLEKNLLSHISKEAGQDTQGSESGLFTGTSRGEIRQILFSSDTMTGLQNDLIVKVRNFANECGATVADFQV